MLSCGVGNAIDPSAQIADNVRLGSHNQIGKNVVISGFKGAEGKEIILGDCNIIHDNTRILIGPKGASIGDWNVFHNNILMMGDGGLVVGSNCWFGQNSILDGSGGLSIGNGVRVGMYSQIWTHVASGELIEGCTLFAERPTVIEDDVWLVGSCIVGSGLTIRYRTICLIGSLLTKDTAPHSVCGGSPAKHLENLSFYREVTPKDKFEMMRLWVSAFASLPENGAMELRVDEGAESIDLRDPQSGESIHIANTRVEEEGRDPKGTYYDLSTKRYSKRLSRLERAFYRYIFGHKARFLPE